jgi:hypothetical protein
MPESVDKIIFCRYNKNTECIFCIILHEGVFEMIRNKIIVFSLLFLVLVFGLLLLSCKKDDECPATYSGGRCYTKNGQQIGTGCMIGSCAATQAKNPNGYTASCSCD